MTQCGFIALIGKPNAGKSTLLNAFVGEKLAVVSRKPQTTRNRILGIVPHEEAQLLFLDTPGLHKHQKTFLGRAMNSVAQQTAGEAQIILYLSDIKYGFDEADRLEMARILAHSSGRCLMILSQADSVGRDEKAAAIAAGTKQIQDWLGELSEEVREHRFISLEPLVLSAKNPEQVADLKSWLARFMPESPWLYPEEDLTDRSQKFLAAELVREQLFRRLGQEIPYGTAVKVVNLIFKPHILVCEAVIYVARTSHRSIVLGKQGAKIKEIGTAAKEAMAAHFGQKVFLDLTVRVEKEWMDEVDQVLDLAHLSEFEPTTLTPNS